MAAQRKYPDELRERAVKMVLEIRELDGTLLSGTDDMDAHGGCDEVDHSSCGCWAACCAAASASS